LHTNRMLCELLRQRQRELPYHPSMVTEDLADTIFGTRSSNPDLRNRLEYTARPAAVRLSARLRRCGESAAAVGR
jgi:hypothetical protein